MIHSLVTVHIIPDIVNPKCNILHNANRIMDIDTGWDSQDLILN